MFSYGIGMESTPSFRNAVPVPTSQVPTVHTNLILYNITESYEERSSNRIFLSLKGGGEAKKTVPTPQREVDFPQFTSGQSKQNKRI